MNILAGFCLAELLGMFFIFFNLLLPGALFFTSKSKLATSCRFDGRRRCTSKIRAGRVFVLFSGVSKGQRPRRGKKTQFQNNSTTTTTLSRAQRKNKNKKLANKTIEKRKKNKTRPGRKKSPRRKHALWTGREKEKRAKKNPSPNFFVHETRRNWPHSAENGIAAMAGSRSPEVAHPECTARNRKTCVKIIIVPEPHNTHSGYWLPLFLTVEEDRRLLGLGRVASQPAAKSRNKAVPPLLL